MDTSNAFSTLNGQAMMHSINVLCPTMTTFVQNTYKQPAHLIFSDGLILTSEKGTMQGEPITMAMYALGLVDLQEK